MNPLRALQDFGQSFWLDDFRRSLVTSGELQALIAEDALSGITSNPSTFEKAIGGSTDYDDALKAMAQERDLDTDALYERLAVEDITMAADMLRPVYDATRRAQERDLDTDALYERLAVEDITMAADMLRPVYDATRRRDGFISIEVSPYLAMDTAATIAEARRLWHAIGRDNLMVKVPATAAGLPAIRQLTGEGINVNITLLFSQTVYEAVAEAYLAGLEALVARGGDARWMASVASFFVSRVDTAVDTLLEERLRQTNRPAERAALQDLLGKAAIANAKLAYQRYKDIFRGERWDRLHQAGARTQRLLWASTGTKSARYSDVRYVEELVGPDTVNTIPPATIDAFRHHGRPRASLEEGVAEARQVMAALDRLGVSLDDITDKLTADGVRLFCDAEDKLLGAIACKHATALAGGLDREKRSARSVARNWRQNAG